MAWTKSPRHLIELFDEVIPDDPRVERRRMFGFPSIFVGGNMCAGLFEDTVFVRLSQADAAALPGGARPFAPMPGRPTKDYVLVPDEAMADEAELAALVAKAVSFTASLPPKQKSAKPRKAKG